MLCSLSLVIPSPSSASHHEHLGLLGILQSTHSTRFDAGLFYLSLSVCAFWHSNISVIKDNLFADNLLLTICNKYVLSYIVECLGATPCRHHQHHHRIPTLALILLCTMHRKDIWPNIINTMSVNFIATVRSRT